jgi:hypothetical protein
VVKGVPIFGMALENAKPDFDMYDLFEKYGEHFLIDMGPGRGLMLTSRSGHDIREVMEEKSDIFQGYASGAHLGLLFLSLDSKNQISVSRFLKISTLLICFYYRKLHLVASTCC